MYAALRKKGGGKDVPAAVAPTLREFEKRYSALWHRVEIAMGQEASSAKKKLEFGRPSRPQITRPPHTSKIPDVYIRVKSRLLP